ncbi:EF-Tu/IF-2/RF-3 family GTPase [Kitasatospora sp. MBT63]|uniref:EF-Tu/IF-2/RF-3 family GTPase n=1 Tax=Kitasatospora sp. MBT63 TaxID=1444768 RepID=UPI00053A4087|nr:EF-Tu/IF-2/RF-3 family GTPase [Kitasatospora sp. MBT63]
MPGTEPSFLMAVEDVFGYHPHGTFVTGEVLRGVVRVGDELEVVGLLPTRRIMADTFGVLRKQLTEARAGRNIAVLIPDINRTQVVVGQVLATPGTVRPHSRLRATLRADRALGTSLQLRFAQRSQVVEATVHLPEGADASALDRPVEITLERPAVFEQGTAFSVVIETRDVGTSIRHLGTGLVTEVLD